MNIEMFAFALEVAGVDSPEILHMKAPYGETILNPRNRPPLNPFERHAWEMRQHGWKYARYPSLTAGSWFTASSWNAIRTGASFAGGAIRLASPLAVPIVLGLVLRTVLGPSDHTRHAAQYEELMYVGSQFGRIQTPHNPHYDRPE